MGVGDGSGTRGFPVIFSPVLNHITQSLLWELYSEK